MTRDGIIESAKHFTIDSKDNCISKEVALHGDFIGMKLFEPPIFAFGSPKDSIYEEFKLDHIIGAHFLPPTEWLPQVKTVISFFLPYTKEIRLSNEKDTCWPSAEWLHGRYEGQVFLEKLSFHLQKVLSDAGYESLVPFFDPRYGKEGAKSRFTSNWSERHIAFACGLGTFGLSKGLITEKGTCGRFGSILTTLDLPKDSRPYQYAYEYCTMCGACIARCPVYAISLEKGKDDLLCSAFLDKVREQNKPRYGCGKCQVKVPCERKIPHLSKVGYVQ